MAQKRNKPTVSMTLDPHVLAAVRGILRRIPGETVTLSGLVEDLLRDFARDMGPMVDAVEATDDPVERLRALEAMFGRQIVQLGQEFASTVSAKSEAKKGR